MPKPYSIRIDLESSAARAGAQAFARELAKADEQARRFSGTLDRAFARVPQQLQQQAQAVRQAVAGHAAAERQVRAAAEAHRAGDMAARAMADGMRRAAAAAGDLGARVQLVGGGAARARAEVAAMAGAAGQARVAMAALDSASARFGHTVVNAGAQARVQFEHVRRQVEALNRATAQSIQARATGPQAQLIGRLAAEDEARRAAEAQRRVQAIGFPGREPAPGGFLGLEPGVGQLEAQREWMRRSWSQMAWNRAARRPGGGGESIFMPPLPAAHEGQIVSVEQMNRSATAARSAFIDRQLAEERRYSQGFVKAVSDREVAQQVANERMRRSNDERVAAAMRAAGLEEQGHDRALKSLGMMIARYATYHLMINTSIQLVRAWGDALERVKQKQDEAIGKFVESRAALRDVAAQLGVPADAALVRQVAGMGARTGAGEEGARQFLGAAVASAGQFVGEAGQVGARLTREQFMQLAERGMAVAEQRGIPQEAMGQVVAEATGRADITREGVPGVERVFAGAMAPFLALQRGKGPPAVLGREFAQFQAEEGAQFRAPLDAAIFLSQVAEARPSGRVHAAGRAFLQQLIAPNEKVQKLLNRVTIERGGRRLPVMRGGAFTGEYLGQDIIEAIRADFERRGLTEIQRQQEISKYFTVKTGLPAARGALGARAAEVEAERRAFVAGKGPADLAAEMAAAAQQPVVQQARAEAGAAAAAAVHGSRVAGATLEIARARQRLEESGGELQPTTWLGRNIGAIFGFDESESMRHRLEAQRGLMADIEKLGGRRLIPQGGAGVETLEIPGVRGTYAPFSNFWMDAAEADRRLQFLYEHRERLRGGAAGGGGAGADWATGETFDFQVSAGGAELTRQLAALNRTLQEVNDTIKAAGRGAPGPMAAAAPPALPFAMLGGPLRG
jgi:hypothetical protein